MSPLGWHPPHLVDNTDTLYLGDQQYYFGLTIVPQHTTFQNF